jgi:1,4-dihydroxy-2-naphthoyl-CoA synthase
MMMRLIQRPAVRTALFDSRRMMATNNLPFELNDIRVNKNEGVTIVTLDRPAARNAFSKSMAQEFTNVVDYLRDDRDTRVVVRDLSLL